MLLLLIPSFIDKNICYGMAAFKKAGKYQTQKEENKSIVCLYKYTGTFSSIFIWRDTLKKYEGTIINCLKIMRSAIFYLFRYLCMHVYRYIHAIYMLYICKVYADVHVSACGCLGMEAKRHP